MRKTFVFLFLMACACTCSAVSLPSIFGEGMVLQRHASIPVWGWGTPGEKVTVTLGETKRKAKVGKDGCWQVSFPSMEAGGPYTLTVTGKTETRSIHEVYVGDVFLFSGQSNQELPVRRCMDNKEVADIARTYINKDVHILKLPQQFNYSSPQQDCKGAEWVSISPETAPGIAAVSYFTARQLQEYAHVPIGIVNSSVGGTKVECWMSYANLSQFPEYRTELQKRKYHQVNWVDSVRTAETTAADEWERRMAANDTVLAKWDKPGYDFSSWNNVDLFSDWTDGRNGAFWFHHTFTLPDGYKPSASRPLLRLGAMKDADEVFVNGKKVGSTSYEYPPRKYSFDDALLHEGQNDILIHLMCQRGHGNFTAGKLYQLEMADTTIALNDGWTMSVGTYMEPRPSQTYFVDTPTGLYNAMISPLGPLAIRGMVWYQGEANMGNPYHYKEYLTSMIKEWHTQFAAPKDIKDGNWPSVIVQLAGFMQRHDAPFSSGWTDIRSQQYATCYSPDASSLNAHLATAMDIGESNDIHPQAKAEMGCRVAMQLIRSAYADNSLISEGPRPVSAVRKGGDIIVCFSEETGKLRYFKDADAEVTGDYQLTIHNVNKGATYTEKDGELRYASDDFPLCTLYNEEGLPAPQFSVKIED